MERETMPADVLFVGAGPANLTAAYTLARRLKEAGREGEFTIMVIEKGKAVGDHILSGAVMDPSAIAEAWGKDWRARGCPVEADVTEEKVFQLTASDAKPLAFIPPTLNNHGNVIVALSEITVWMKSEVEALGVLVAEGQPAASPVISGGAVTGVHLVDQGLNPDGSRGDGFTPGAAIEARVTVFGEGSRGSCTKILVDRLALNGPNPQVYGTGVKELWDIPKGRIRKGTVWHSAGWPLPSTTYGGSWCYAQSDTRVSIGFVTALDGGDPTMDPHGVMQTWKRHPMMSALLAGGTLIKSGAKTIPEGGWWSRPRSHGEGFLIIGDSGSLTNIARLKGIHTAIKSGQIAGDVLFEALVAGDVSATRLAAYETRLADSAIGAELRRARNWRQAFTKGFTLGSLHAGLMWLFDGALFQDRLPIHTDAAAMHRLDGGHHHDHAAAKPDGKLTFDKLTSVYQAGSIHDEHQPSHLKVADPSLCAGACARDYGNPCEKFCPAAVYEMVDAGAGQKKLQINFSNCVHCKTCDILDPYQVITWTVPADAGGPKYLGL